MTPHRKKTIRFHVSKPVLCGREKEYALDAIDSGWISGSGSYIGRFERAIADFIGVDECRTVVNGTAALHLACLAMGLRAGDEVLVPGLTYVASANAVAYCGAIPVFADCARDTWNSSAEMFERVCTPRTVGVIAVHLYGLPSPVDEIADFCKRRGLWLIEDCAESLGASLNGKSTGTFGDAAMFSFYGNKTISTGEGGMVYFRDPEKRRLGEILRGQGMDPVRRYWHSHLGYNYRMTNIAAAIGLGQAEMLDFHLQERRRISNRYMERLAPLAHDGLLQLPARPMGFTSSHWLFSAVLTSGGQQRRDSLMHKLANDHGIETRPFFVSMPDLPIYAGNPTLPVAEYLSSHGMNFPTYTGLLDHEIDEICEATDFAVREAL
jgi:perosamine synthetase